MTSFTGFPAQTTDFLAALAANNDKDRLARYGRERPEPLHRWLVDTLG